MWTRIALAASLALLTGCASVPGGRDRARVSVEALLAGRPLDLAQARGQVVDEDAVLAVSPDMQAFLARHVKPGSDRVARLRQLGNAMMHTDRFKLEYDETTRTAAATFEARRGNCLSFSNLFVAMARQVGLNARFQEVDTPPDWSFRDDAFVLNRHIDVLVDFGAGESREDRTGSLARGVTTLAARPSEGGEHIVDFNMDDFRTSYDRRAISDARAFAHYYNNVAVERMRAGDTAAAFGNFRKAIDEDPSFSPAWTNLGILYMRGGHPTYAEAAQLQALAVDPHDPVAMSNLATLYDRQGDHERAAVYRKRVADHRNKNPYYRFELARQAFGTGDYDAAIGHLKDAIRKKKNEDQFYFLLGLSYLKKGDPRSARRWLTRAEEVAATDALKRRYADKMDILLPPPQEQGQPR